MLDLTEPEPKFMHPYYKCIQLLTLHLLSFFVSEMTCNVLSTSLSLRVKFVMVLCPIVHVGSFHFLE